MIPTKPKRGGSRPGSGRKPIPGKRRFTCVLSPEDHALLTELKGVKFIRSALSGERARRKKAEKPQGLIAMINGLMDGSVKIEDIA